MSKNLSGKYCQENIERLQKKKLVKDIKIVNVTKISQKIKNKSLLSIAKNIKKWEKTFYYNYFIKVMTQ